MNDLFRFLVQYEIPIYVVLSLGAVFVARSLWKAWREWRIAVFGLEKELTFQRVRAYGAALTLLVMFGLSQFCLVSFVVPFLPSASFLPTPTTDLLQTPNASAQAGTIAAEIGTPAADAAVSNATGCIPGQINLTSPQPGQQVQSSIILSGTVNVPNFGFYKYEYAALGSDQWTTVAAGDKIISEGELGRWDTSQLVPGDYQIRLIITDNLGVALPACIVPVRVIAP